MTTATKRIEPIDISDHPEVVAERDRLADVEQRAATIDAEIRRRATPTRPDRDEQAARFIDGHLPGDEDATRRAELGALQKDRQTARRALELQRARVRVAEREAAVELLSDRRDEYGALARAVGKAAADFLKACEAFQEAADSGDGKRVRVAKGQGGEKKPEAARGKGKPR